MIRLLQPATTTPLPRPGHDIELGRRKIIPQLNHALLIRRRNPGLPSQRPQSDRMMLAAAVAVAGAAAGAARARAPETDAAADALPDFGLVEAFYQGLDEREVGEGYSEEGLH